jgi:hypothetical protein
LFGLSCGDPIGPFVPVAINEHLTFDFDDRRKPVEVHHYAFHVSSGEFDAIFGRIKARGLKHGSGPYSNEDMTVGEFNGGRVVYFRELNNHLLEIRTKTSAEDIAGMRRAH